MDEKGGPIRPSVPAVPSYRCEGVVPIFALLLSAGPTILIGKGHVAPKRLRR